MKIQKIKKLKSGKYKLELEDGTSIQLYDEVILNHNLLFHKGIDSELFSQIDKENSYYYNYYKVLKYVLYKMRSRYEIEEYMTKQDISIENQNKILEKLEKNNLLNDSLFIKSFISDKVHLSNDGPNKIKNELLKYKMEESEIEEILQEYDDKIFEEKLEKLIQKKMACNKTKSIFAMKQKLLNYLINLGYDYDLIIQKLDHMKGDNNLIIKKEYDRLFRKLCKKYEGEELKYQIKNRLYQKGFSSDDINQII